MSITNLFFFLTTRIAPKPRYKLRNPSFCVVRFNTSNVFGLDETMSAFKPQKTKTGGLPNITYILRKPEPLGTEFKNGCCSKTGVMTFMELQRGKNGMKEAQYNRELGATAGCPVRLSE